MERRRKRKREAIWKTETKRIRKENNNKGECGDNKEFG